MRITSRPPYPSEKKIDSIVYLLRNNSALPGFLEIASDDNFIVFALGGSGAKTASAKAFLRNAVSLKKYGIALLSVDYPLHNRVPTGPKYFLSKVFLQ